jgi:DNA replication protein DnaC
MIKFLKKIAPFLILVSFLILSALLPEILGEDAKKLAESYLGDNYKYILVSFFLVLFFIVARINPEIGMGLFSKTDKSNPERYNIPPTDENHELLRKAKAAIAASHPDQALELLSTLKLKTLDIEITALSARLADLERTQRFGTESYDTETREHNKINKSIIFLITALEKEIAQSFEFYDKIRAALKSRYETRLSQKLSNRQPVNLRLVPSTSGTTSQAANTFVQYSEGKIRGKLAEYYKDANGRLLLVGVPGAGKTTLLLQLELELLEQEATRIPVILNLVRWSSTFSKLEDWIQEILPSEMGLTINKKMAGDLIEQDRLILLLDGLDEIKEENRQVCLEAIGIYGEDPDRHFIISSRIEEYKAAAKDAPVNSQVEVGTLKYEQLIEQLEKTEQNQGSKRLLTALREDEVLREIAEVPFYFNILQLLFARGKFLPEFKFSAQDVEGRKKEIERSFAVEMLRNSDFKGEDSNLIVKYLGFFASRLKRENLVDFELIHLQYNWAKVTKWETWIGIFFKGLVRGLVVNVVGGLILGLVYGWVANVGGGLVLGLLGSLGGGLVGVLVLGLVGGLSGGLVGVLGGGLAGGLGGLLIGGLGGSLIGSQVGGFGGSQVGTLVGGLIGGLGGWRFGWRGVGFPSISTREKFKWNWKVFIPLDVLGIGLGVGLVMGLGVGLAAGLGVGLALGLGLGIIKQLENNLSFIQINDPYQRFKASAKVFYFSILQHWHLRYLLSKKGFLHFKLVSFLNDMVACNILETTGASWRFRHRILQDYFADQWVETEFESEQK